MATPQEIKELQKLHPWRYKFDRETGVCLSVDDRSLADRFPLDCDHSKVACIRNSCVAMPFNADKRAEGHCPQSASRIARWHAYLSKELK